MNLKKLLFIFVLICIIIFSILYYIFSNLGNNKSINQEEFVDNILNKFQEYKDTGRFKFINPFLISSEISGEEALFVPTNYNVYVLPRDLYKKGGRLMQGSMDNFLQNMTLDEWLGGKNKKIYLIKDECHVATNNLDTLSSDYFEKILNFSATPKLSRNQIPDVEITDNEAVNAKLIKYVELGDEEDVGVAINKFEEIQKNENN